MPAIRVIDWYYCGIWPKMCFAKGKKLFVECWGVKEGDLREAFESIG